MKLWKWLFIVFFGSLVLLVVRNWSSVSYAWVQARGQFKVIFNTVPVEDVLESQFLADSLKQKIKLINDIKCYAIDSLGLSPSGSYTSYYDQKGKPIIWMITAAPPYELKAKTWEFPILGSFRYKGYFDMALVEEELALLRNEGFETKVSEVSAWSTLGILNDPILSSMLDKSEAELASLIIHELTHGTLFVKDDLSFNENLASFIGEQGALLYLKNKYGKDHYSLEEVSRKKERKVNFRKNMVAGAKSLDSLYQTFGTETTSKEKEIKKWGLIREVLERSTYRLYTIEETKTYNNAYFVSFLTYKEKQGSFDAMLADQFGGNLREFLKAMKDAHDPLLPWQ